MSTHDPAPDESARLRALHALQVLDTPPEERFDRVTRLACRLFEVESAAVNLIADDRQWTKSVAGTVPTYDMPRAESVCTIAIQQDETLMIPDLRADPRFASMPYVIEHPHARFYAGQPLSAPGGARVGTLCLLDRRPRSLTDGDLALLRDLGMWVQKELAMDEELSRAADVQRGLLPSTPPAVESYDIAGTCLPSRQVGGDLFDWYLVGDRIGLTVADVMGKGMPAAIMMSALRAVLRAGSRAGDVVASVELASGAMEADFSETGAFATLLHGRLDTASGRITYVDAGHGLAMHVASDGTAAPLVGRGLPAGAVPDATWAPCELVLAPGDSLVVYSDGLLDLHSDKAAVDAQVVEAVTTTSTAADVVEHLTWAARSLSLPDDVTVLVVRRAA